jgi:tungstate transport system ATP-binding protein
MKIEINNLTKDYHGNTVLNLVSDSNPLVFESGMIHGIIGPNGSGKTTLMKIIAGIISQTNGTVLYDGDRLNSKLRKKITYSSHQPTLFSRSVYNNIAYPLKIRNISKKEIHKIVSNLLVEFDLYNIRNHDAKKLSGGESQKTALARALSFSPKVLCLDEPTANIDPKSVQLIESALLKRQKNDNLSIIIITHNLSQALRLCSKITFLNQSRFIYTGSPEDLINSSDPFIQDFISYNCL